MDKFQLFLIGCLISVTYGGLTTPTPPSDIQLTASTSTIHPSCTKSLTITCSFLHQQASEMSAVTSLILAKTPSVGGTQYTEISTLTVTSPDTVAVKDDLGAKVTGTLRMLGNSTIVYEWTNPGRSAEGKYRCTAHGLNNLGHPVMTSSDTVVEEQSVNLQMLLEKLQSLEREQNVLTGQLNNTSRELQTATSDLNATKLQLQSLKNDQITSNHDIVQLQQNQNPHVMFTGQMWGGGHYTDGQVLVFPHLITSVGGGYDNSTGVFTAPVAGYYVIAIHVMSETDKMVGLSIKHNDTRIAFAYTSGGSGTGYQTASNNVVVLAQQGDTFRVTSIGDSYIDHYSSYASTFTVRLVSTV